MEKLGRYPKFSYEILTPTFCCIKCKKEVKLFPHFYFCKPNITTQTYRRQSILL